MKTGPGSLLAAAAASVALTVNIAKADEVKVKISRSGHSVPAQLDDNPTSRALWAKMPLAVSMENLYGRELCHRFKDALPVGETNAEGYVIGEIAYWPPRHSLVILYAQNGERLERVTLGRVEGGDGAFATVSTAEVRFERDDQSVTR